MSNKKNKMNKKFLAISIGLLMAGMATVVLAQAYPGTIEKCTMRNTFSSDWGIDCPVATVDCPFTSTSYDCPACCVIDTIYTVTDWIFAGVILIAGILVILGAYKIMTAGGAPDNVNTGRSYIIWAMVGLAVALLAKSIPAIIKAILKVS